MRASARQSLARSFGFSQQPHEQWVRPNLRQCTPHILQCLQRRNLGSAGTVQGSHSGRPGLRSDTAQQHCLALRSVTLGGGRLPEHKSRVRVVTAQQRSRRPRTWHGPRAPRPRHPASPAGRGTLPRRSSTQPPAEVSRPRPATRRRRAGCGRAHRCRPTSCSRGVQPGARTRTGVPSPRPTSMPSIIRSRARRPGKPCKRCRHSKGTAV